MTLLLTKESTKLHFFQRNKLLTPVNFVFYSAQNVISSCLNLFFRV